MIIQLISSGFFLSLVCVVVPVLAWISKKQIDKGLTIRRLPFYAEAVVVQIVLFGIALWTAHASEMEIRFLQVPQGVDIVAGLGLLALAMGTMALTWPLASTERRERLVAMVPRSTPERLAWIGVSAVAGVAEETIYRGVLLSVFAGMTGSWWISAIASSIFFGLGHLVQGWKSSGIVMVFAFAFHLLVAFTGSLMIAIVVHFSYDLIVGLALGMKVEPPAEGNEHAEAL